MTRGKWLLIIILVLAIPTVMFIHYYNPLIPANIKDYLDLQLSEMENSNKIMPGTVVHNTTYSQVMFKFEKNWRNLEKQLRRKGGSEAEVHGVLATARKHFSGTSEYDIHTYGVPMYANRIWHRYKPIWIIGFCWGIGYNNPKQGITEEPTHVRIIAIESRKPYRELGMATCQ